MGALLRLIAEPAIQWLANRFPYIKRLMARYQRMMDMFVRIALVATIIATPAAPWYVIVLNLAGVAGLAGAAMTRTRTDRFARFGRWVFRPWMPESRWPEWWAETKQRRELRRRYWITPVAQGPHRLYLVTDIILDRYGNIRNYMADPATRRIWPLP